MLSYIGCHGKRGSLEEEKERKMKSEVKSASSLIGSEATEREREREREALCM